MIEGTPTRVVGNSPRGSFRREEAFPGVADHCLDAARREQRHLMACGLEEDLESILRRSGWLSSEYVGEMLRDADAAILRVALPAGLCRRLRIVPIALRDGVLILSVERTPSVSEQEEIIEHARGARLAVDRVEPSISPRENFLKIMRETIAAAGQRLSDDIRALNRDAANGALVQSVITDLLGEALQMRASDIKFDCYESPDRCWVHYRIDGVRRQMHLLAPEAMRYVTTRIKDDAGLDSSARQTPQDGRLTYHWQGRQVDVRVASLPAALGGERITLRLLDKASLIPLPRLFANEPVILQSLIDMFSGGKETGGGMLLISGPTGSGKTTTLYGLLHAMERLRRDVLTVEDPIEYIIEHITQTAVADIAGRSFAEIIRAWNRHDPDVLVIGETRDAITAEGACRAAESGHKVISTIHANDSAQTIERFISNFSEEYADSGKFVISHYLQGVINQSLQRTLCPNCSMETTAKQAFLAHPKIFERLHFNDDDLVRQADPVGCDICGHTGYRGRRLVAEALFMPKAQAARRHAAEIIASGDYHALSRLDGMTVVRRVDTVVAMLRSGAFDVQTSVPLLGGLPDHDSEQEAMIFTGMAGIMRPNYSFTGDDLRR